MTPRQLLAAGAAAIALLLAGSVWLLWRLDQPGRGAGTGPSGSAPAASGPTLAPAGLTVLDLPAAPPPPPAPREPAFQPSVRGLPQAPALTPWVQVPVAVKLSDLGPLAAAVNAGLEEARQDMAPCFRAEAAAPAEAPATADDPPTGPAVLVLQLESREKGLDLVDTEVESRGTSSRQLIACCRKALKGWSFAAEKAAAGKRYRLKYLLQ